MKTVFEDLSLVFEDLSFTIFERFLSNRAMTWVTYVSKNGKSLGEEFEKM